MRCRAPIVACLGLVLLGGGCAPASADDEYDDTGSCDLEPGGAGPRCSGDDDSYGDEGGDGDGDGDGDGGGDGDGDGDGDPHCESSEVPSEDRSVGVEVQAWASRTPGGLAAYPGGGYVIAGRRTENDQGYPWVRRFDPSGELVWERDFEDSGAAWHVAVFDDDIRFFVVDGLELYLWTIDHAGELLSQEFLCSGSDGGNDQDSSRCSGAAILPLAGGGMVLQTNTSVTTPEDHPEDGPTTSRTSWVRSYDAAGEELFEWHLDEPQNAGYPRVAALADGDFVVAERFGLRRRHADGSEVWYVEPEEYYLHRVTGLSASSEEIWLFDWTDFGNYHAAQIHVLDDEGALAKWAVLENCEHDEEMYSATFAGPLTFVRGASEGPFAEWDHWIMRVDQDMSFAWRDHVDVTDQLRDPVVRPDASLAVVGAIYEPDEAVESVSVLTP